MRHFIGGYALTAMLVAWWSLEKARVNLGQAIIAGLLVGWVGGLAAWGLLP